ncbi:hypothetical protein CK203_046836 [Vitis vinifera]|uniref:Uncharacterized protein n=1 Tax=Vitis vinifera TaxID=29760 RepID=A0A438HYC5_VITVI|nr:hypothetical protein CK203_046836 [Vitis vinifera]
MHHFQLSRTGPHSKIIKMARLIGYMQGLSYMASSQYAMPPINEEVSRGQQVLHMVSSQQGLSQMDFGAREVVAEAPQALLAGGDGTGDGTGEGTDNASPEALAARASTEGKLLLAAEAQKWDLERAPLAGLSCGLKERRLGPSGSRHFGLPKFGRKYRPEKMNGAKIIFAATSQSVSQLRIECHCAAKWHTCAKIAFAIAKYPAEWALVAKSGIFTLYRFAAVSQLRMGVPVLRSGTRVPNLASQLRKFSQRSNELRNDFAKDGRFRRET